MVICATQALCARRTCEQVEIPHNDVPLRVLGGVTLEPEVGQAEARMLRKLAKVTNVLLRTWNPENRLLT